MKTIKKPVSILLAVLMVFSVFAVVPFTASAATVIPADMSEAENNTKYFVNFTHIEDDFYDVGGASADKLFDGTDAKLCAYGGEGGRNNPIPWTQFYVEFSYNTPIVPTAIYLRTAGDTNEYPNRNPKSWELYGKNSSDGWDLIKSVTNDDTMRGENNTSYRFSFDNATAYKDFKFVVSGVGHEVGPQGQEWGYCVQLSELYMSGFPTVGVTFNTDGGSTVEPQTIAINSKVTKPADPTKAGYTFGGWYKEQDCTNAWNFDTDTAAEATTLYAKWAPNKYTVTWKNWDGEVLETDNDVVAGTTPTYDGETPTKADDDNDYTFTGWDPAVVAVTADATYTAQFTATPYVASVTTADGTTTKYTDFGTALGAWTDGSTLTLLADVQTSSTINVTGTKTLDLNGYGITKSGQGRVFKVDGNLTINDSNPTRSTHNYSVDSTGLASLDNDGTQSFQGGYITGGYGFDDSGATGWGGFALVDQDRNGNCSLTINGGTIIGNKTEIGGGGVVRLNGNSTFTMNGGAIIYNTTAYLTQSQVNDGAVSGEENVTFYIRGGTIAHNTTKGGVASDLYLASGQKIIVNKELNSDTSIGIKMQSNTGVFTNSAETANNDASKFFSDNSNYNVRKNPSGQLEIGNGYTVTWKNWDGTVLETDENVLTDTTPTYNGATPTKPSDSTNNYYFTGWEPTVDAITGDTTYTATYRSQQQIVIKKTPISAWALIRIIMLTGSARCRTARDP